MCVKGAPSISPTRINLSCEELYARAIAGEVQPQHWPPFISNCLGITDGPWSHCWDRAGWWDVETQTLVARDNTTRVALEKCQECGSATADVACDKCEASYCDRCFQSVHRDMRAQMSIAQRERHQKAHTRRPLVVSQACESHATCDTWSSRKLCSQQLKATTTTSNHDPSQP